MSITIDLPFRAIATTALAGASNVLGAMASQPSSFMARTAVARIEPVAMVDERATLSPMLNDTLSVLMNVFLASYASLYELKKHEATDDQVLRRIQVSDTRAGRDSLFASMLSFECPSLSGTQNLLEQAHDVDESVYAEGLPTREYYSQEAVTNSKLFDGLNDQPALAMGRMLELELPPASPEEKTPRIVRIAVRMMVVEAQTKILEDALTNRFQGEESALERRHGWRSGRLSTIGDMLFGLSQLREHRRALMRDRSGIYDRLTPNRARDRSLIDLARGNYSVAEASNLMVLDQDTASEVELRVGGKFKDLAFRQRMLQSTGIMAMAIINRGDDMVTFYFDSIAEGTRLSNSALRTAGKKDGPDTGKILEALLTGSSPRFS